MNTPNADDDFTPGCKPPPHPLGEVYRWAQVAANSAYWFPGKPELRKALAETKIPEKEITKRT